MREVLVKNQSAGDHAGSTVNAPGNSTVYVAVEFT